MSLLCGVEPSLRALRRSGGVTATSSAQLRRRHCDPTNPTTALLLLLLPQSRHRFVLLLNDSPQPFGLARGDGQHPFEDSLAVGFVRLRRPLSLSEALPQHNRLSGKHNTLLCQLMLHGEERSARDC